MCANRRHLIQSNGGVECGQSITFLQTSSSRGFSHPIGLVTGVAETCRGRWIGGGLSSWARASRRLARKASAASRILVIRFCSSSCGKRDLSFLQKLVVPAVPGCGHLHGGQRIVEVLRVALDLGHQHFRPIGSHCELKVHVLDCSGVIAEDDDGRLGFADTRPVIHEASDEALALVHDRDFTLRKELRPAGVLMFPPDASLNTSRKGSS